VADVNGDRIPFKAEAFKLHGKWMVAAQKGELPGNGLLVTVRPGSDGEKNLDTKRDQIEGRKSADLDTKVQVWREGKNIVYAGGPVFPKNIRPDQHPKEYAALDKFLKSKGL
jgi:hypothetical protein